jgi:hypothetical protein
MGARVPLVEWPPGYPAALALADLIGLDEIGAARFVAVVGVAVVATAAFVMLAMGSGSILLGIAGSALLLLGPTEDTYLGSQSPLGWSVVIVSERAFLPLTMASLAIAAWSPRISWSRWARFGVLLGLVAAVISVRYVGLSVAVAVVVGLLADRWGSRHLRFTLASAVLVVAGVTFLLPGIVAGVPKSVAWHPPASLDPIVDTMGAWFSVPTSWPLALRAIIVAALFGVPVVLALARGIVGWAPSGPDRVALIVAIFVVSYLVAVFVTVFWLDAVVGLQQRVLGPTQLGAYVLLVIEIHRCLRRATAPLGRSVDWIPTTLASSMVGLLLLAPLTTLGADRAYLSRLRSAQLAHVEQTPLRGFDDLVVFTDDPSTVWTATGQLVYVLPSRTTLTTGRPNRSFDADVDEVARILREIDGVALVYGAGTAARPSDLEARGLVVIDECAQAVVLASPRSERWPRLAGLACDLP